MTAALQPDTWKDGGTPHPPDKSNWNNEATAIDKKEKTHLDARRRVTDPAWAALTRACGTRALV